MFSLDHYEAARRSAAIVTRSSQGQISLTGGDRRSFLHALLTNDIARLTAGAGAYAAYLTPQGRMISDMRVIETGERILLGVEGPLAQPLSARLDGLIFSEDVQVTDVTAELCEIGVHGPSAASVIQTATGIDSARLEHQYDNVSERGITVVRDDEYGVPGFNLIVTASGSDPVRRMLSDAGATEIGEETAEVLRIEAGRPRFGSDMSTETIPLEAGIEGRAISLTKGCYIGQEVIIRILHRGHGRVARRLVGLLIAGDVTPSPGDALVAGEQEIGKVTSAAVSPVMGAPIALGYVQRDHATAGTELGVKSAAGRLAARVHQLPFAAP